MAKVATVSERAPRLGKRPPFRYYADVAVKAAAFVTPRKVLPSVPRTSTWGAGITFGVFLNDRLPDCTCAAWAHSEQIHSQRADRPERPTDDAVRELFHRTGIEQGLSDNDGRYMEGVLRSLRLTGFRQDVGDVDSAVGSFEKLTGYAAVAPTNVDEVRACVYLFGGLYAGVALPVSAYYQYRDGKNWSYTTTNNTPGGWGGHAMWIASVNATGPVFITWGKRKQATWAWWRHYADECWAVVSDDWAQIDQRAPSGFARQELLDTLAAL